MALKNIINILIIAEIILLFGCERKSVDYQVAEIYNDLRNQAFSISPEKIGIKLTDDNSIYGILMETGFPEAVVTLVAMGDGSVSLYFSNGGGIIGIGDHEAPRKLSLRFIKESNKYIKFTQKVNDLQLPKQDETIFYFLTKGGVLSYKDLEENLGNDKSDLSALFFLAHELIAEARKAEEQNNKDK